MIIARRFEPRCGRPSPASAQRVVSVVTKRAPARGSGISVVARGGIADDDRRARIADHVLELGRRMRDGQRHGHAAGAPDAALHGRIGEARRHEERDARLVQVVVVGEQRSGDAPRGVVELVVGERAVGGDDRGATAHGIQGQDSRSIVQGLNAWR